MVFSRSENFGRDMTFAGESSLAQLLNALYKSVTELPWSAPTIRPMASGCTSHRTATHLETRSLDVSNSF